MEPRPACAADPLDGTEPFDSPDRDPPTVQKRTWACTPGPATADSGMTGSPRAPGPLHPRPRRSALTTCHDASHRGKALSSLE